MVAIGRGRAIERAAASEHHVLCDLQVVERVIGKEELTDLVTVPALQHDRCSNAQTHRAEQNQQRWPGARQGAIVERSASERYSVRDRDTLTFHGPPLRTCHTAGYSNVARELASTCARQQPWQERRRDTIDRLPLMAAAVRCPCEAQSAKLPL